MLLNSPANIQATQNQTYRLFLFEFSLWTKNPEVEILLFLFLWFFPFHLFVPYNHKALCRTVTNLVQEINTERVRIPLQICILCA